jgi:hypothetical protein
MKNRKKLVDMNEEEKIESKQTYIACSINGMSHNKMEKSVQEDFGKNIPTSTKIFQIL